MWRVCVFICVFSCLSSPLAFIYHYSILSIFVHFQQSRRKLNSMFTTTTTATEKTVSLINRCTSRSPLIFISLLTYVLFAALFFKRHINLAERTKLYITYRHCHHFYIHTWIDTCIRLYFSHK